MDEPRRLYRSEGDRMLAGVCGGLGAFFGLDPTLIRVLFALFALLTGGGGLLLYLAMWLIVPRESRVQGSSREVVREGFDEVRDQAQRGARGARHTYERLRGRPDGSQGSTSEE